VRVADLIGGDDGVAELALERFEMRANLGVGRSERLDLAHRAHDGRVIAVAEGPADLGEAALQALLAEVHRHVPREGHALVPVLRHEIRRSQVKMVADGPLDILHALGLRPLRHRRAELRPRERQIHRPPRERRLRREPNQRPLELAHVRPDHLGQIHGHVGRKLKALERGFVPHDGDARLELRHLDVGHEPPREARHEALLHPL